MRSFLAVVISLATLSLVALAQCPALTVRLSSDKDSYSLRGTLQLKVVRENTGNCSVAMPRRWDWGALSKIRVFDAKGNENKDVLYAIDDPPLLRSVDFIILNPGEWFGTQYNEVIRAFVKKPGDYDFLVEYRTYLSEDLTEKYVPRRYAVSWSRERPPVKSNKITLHMTD